MLFLQLDPVDVNDLAIHRWLYGFDNLDFTVACGFIEGRVCVATRKLPDYGIADVRTGKGRIWKGRIDVAEPVDGGTAAP